jgi:hypothetical protein
MKLINDCIIVSILLTILQLSIAYGLQFNREKIPSPRRKARTGSPGMAPVPALIIDETFAEDVI